MRLKNQAVAQKPRRGGQQTPWDLRTSLQQRSTALRSGWAAIASWSKVSGTGAVCHRIAHPLLLGIHIPLSGKIFKHAKAISSRAARDCQILPYKMTVCGQHVQDAEPGLTLAWDWERWLLRTNSRRNTAGSLHFKTKHAIGDGERDGCWVSASSHLTLPALRISAPASSSRFT